MPFFYIYIKYHREGGNGKGKQYVLKLNHKINIINIKTK